VSILSEPRLVPADEISVGFAPVVLENVFSAYLGTGS
jgi:ABC-type branched-subunit amino acid transport system ATPase component